MYYTHERGFLQSSIFHFPTLIIKGDCAGNKKICATQVKTYSACIVLERGFEVCRPVHTLHSPALVFGSNTCPAWTGVVDRVGARQATCNSPKLGLLAMLSQWPEYRYPSFHSINLKKRFWNYNFQVSKQHSAALMRGFKQLWSRF